MEDKTECPPHAYTSFGVQKQTIWRGKNMSSEALHQGFFEHGNAVKAVQAAIDDPSIDLLGIEPYLQVPDILSEQQNKPPHNFNMLQGAVKALADCMNDDVRTQEVIDSTKIYIDAVKCKHGLGAIDDLISSLQYCKSLPDITLRCKTILSRGTSSLYVQALDSPRSVDFFEVLMRAATSPDVVNRLTHRNRGTGFASTISSFITAALAKAAISKMSLGESSLQFFNADAVVRMCLKHANKERIWNSWVTGDPVPYGRVVDTIIGFGFGEYLHLALPVDQNPAYHVSRDFSVPHRLQFFESTFTVKTFAIACGTDVSPTATTIEEAMDIIDALVAFAPTCARSIIAAHCVHSFRAFPEALEYGMRKARSKKYGMTSLLFKFGVAIAIRDADQIIECIQIMGGDPNDARHKLLDFASGNKLPVCDDTFEKIRLSRRVKKKCSSTSIVTPHAEPEYACITPAVSSIRCNRFPSTHVHLDSCPLRCMCNVDPVTFKISSDDERLVVKCSARCKTFHYHWKCYPSAVVQAASGDGDVLGSQRSWTSIAKDPNAKCLTPGCDGTIVYAAREGGEHPRVLVHCR